MKFTATHYTIIICTLIVSWFVYCIFDAQYDPQREVQETTRYIKQKDIEHVDYIKRLEKEEKNRQLQAEETKIKLEQINQLVAKGFTPFAARCAVYGYTTKHDLTFCMKANKKDVQPE